MISINKPFISLKNHLKVYQIKTYQSWKTNFDYTYSCLQFPINCYNIYLGLIISRNFLRTSQYKIVVPY